MMTLFAPIEYWQLTPDAHDEICNGCGRAGWKGQFVPDHLLFLSIKSACDIHDYMYHVGVGLSDKDEADRIFLNNMLRLIEGKSIWLLKRDRMQMAKFYYVKVKYLGGPAFWEGKNSDECLGLMQAV